MLICKNGNKTNCSTCRGVSFLSTTYTLLYNILLSRLTTYLEELFGDHVCGFGRNRSTTDHGFRIRQILEKKREYSEAGRQLFIDFKKAYDAAGP
jgi:hypothetical protein